MNTLRDLGRTVLLCLVGGSADAIAYLRFDTFVGAMTGNTILLGIDIVEGRAGRAIYHVCIVAAFLAAVIVARTLLSRLPVIVPLTVTAVMLGASQLISSAWGAALSAAALGLQNAAVRKIGGVPLNTVFVTGDLVSLGSAVSRASAPKRNRRVILLSATWIAYTCGAVLGAAALRLLSYPMIVPAALTLLAAIVETYVRRNASAEVPD